MKSRPVIRVNCRRKQGKQIKEYVGTTPGGGPIRLIIPKVQLSKQFDRIGKGLRGMLFEGKEQKRRVP